MKANVVLSRTYEIDLNECEGENILEQLHSAKQKAMNEFAEEMIYFESSVDDFLSAKITNENQLIIKAANGYDR